MSGNRGNNRDNLTDTQFKPGQSGNPDGRPKGSKGFRERCRLFADDEGLNTLIEIAQNLNNKDRLKAVELLLAYGYGKPKQGVELSGEDGDNIRIIVEGV